MCLSHRSITLIQFHIAVIRLVSLSLQLGYQGARDTEYPNRFKSITKMKFPERKTWLPLIIVTESVCFFTECLLIFGYQDVVLGLYYTGSGPHFVSMHLAAWILKLARVYIPCWSYHGTHMVQCSRSTEIACFCSLAVDYLSVQYECSMGLRLQANFSQTPATVMSRGYI